MFTKLRPQRMPFYIDKAIFKKVKRYGLERAYRNNEDIKAYIRKIMALPFLPVLLLRNSYNVLKRRCRRLIRRNPRLARLNRYFERTWLNGEFPIPLWNCLTALCACAPQMPWRGGISVGIDELVWRTQIFGSLLSHSKRKRQLCTDPFANLEGTSHLHNREGITVG